MIHPAIRDYYQVPACKPPLRKHSDRIFRVLRPHHAIFSLFFLLLPRFLPVYPPLRCSPPALLIRVWSNHRPFRPRFDCPHTITLFCLSPQARVTLLGMIHSQRFSCFSVSVEEHHLLGCSSTHTSIPRSAIRSLVLGSHSTLISGVVASPAPSVDDSW